ncbi:MAG: peptidylprolyl isomerase [Actinomycetes bacterium]
MSNKRDRELARAKYERQQVRRTARQQRAHIRNRIVALFAVVAVILGYGALKGKNPTDTSAQPSSSASAQPSAITTEQAVASCDKPAALRADNVTFQSEPTGVKAAKSIVLSTNCGDIAIKTNPQTPHTAGIMSFLTQKKFFDGVGCHRLTTSGIYVLQCGDPSFTGSGGPGFKFADENLPTAGADGSYTYKRGDVAMANSGPDTNGSQFFLVYQDSVLGPNYTLWGNISKGLDVIDAVAGAGVVNQQQDGAPSQTIVIAQAKTAQ